MKDSNLSPNYVDKDYHPFGMEMMGRNYTANYRYGFNGKENTDEIYGDDIAVDFGARIYDARLGRWMSVDKKERDYTGNSPYGFGLNSPILFVDPDGNGILGFNSLSINKSGTQVTAVKILDAGNFQSGYLKDNFGDDGTNNINKLDISFASIPGLKDPNTGASVQGLTGVFVVTVSGAMVDLSTYIDKPDDPTDNIDKFEVAVRIEQIDDPENQAETAIHEVTIHGKAYKALIDQYYTDGNLSQLQTNYTTLVNGSPITNHQDIGNNTGDYAKVCGDVIKGLTGPTYAEVNVNYGYETPNNKDTNGNYIISPNAAITSESGNKVAQKVNNTVVNQFIYHINQDISNYDTSNSNSVDYIWTNK